MNWYIGQEVVYIGPPNLAYAKDELGKITLIQQGCSHYPVIINTNNKRVPVGNCLRCDKCGFIGAYPGQLTLFTERVFAPLMDISELESILKEETINK